MTHRLTKISTAAILVAGIAGPAGAQGFDAGECDMIRQLGPDAVRPGAFAACNRVVDRRRTVSTTTVETSAGGNPTNGKPTGGGGQDGDVTTVTTGTDTGVSVTVGGGGDVATVTAGGDDGIGATVGDGDVATVTAGDDGINATVGREDDPLVDVSTSEPASGRLADVSTSDGITASVGPDDGISATVGGSKGLDVSIGK